MSYFTRAMVEAALAGGLAAVVGVHVVLRRLSFFTMAMTHATFPGVVLAALLGIDLYLGSGLFGILVVLAVAWLTTRRGAEQSSAVGVVLATGFALGVALMSAQDGFTKDLSSFLVGSILTVDNRDLAVTAVAFGVVGLTLVLLRKELLLAAFDRQSLLARGYPALALDIVLLLLVEITVVTLIPAVGTILSVALIVAPAATARLWCSSIAGMTALAAVLGAGSGLLGLVVSDRADIAAGASIVLVACAAFAVSLVLRPTYSWATSTR